MEAERRKYKARDDHLEKVPGEVAAGEFLRASRASARHLSSLIDNGGLPWWHSGWESACQCGEHGFDPWSGRIPHATEQLSPCTTTTEPVL